MGKFELNSPWWISGENDDAHIICAAVRARSEDHAKLLIIMSHDVEHVEWASQDINWRFVEERPDTWSPFSDRFPRAEWMKWRVVL
jgi:hypothetical protein